MWTGCVNVLIVVGCEMNWDVDKSSVSSDLRFVHVQKDNSVAPLSLCGNIGGGTAKLTVADMFTILETFFMKDRTKTTPRLSNCLHLPLIPQFNLEMTRNSIHRKAYELM